MGATDKIAGRVKQAVGDLTGNEATRRKGQQQERLALTRFGGHLAA